MINEPMVAEAVARGFRGWYVRGFLARVDATEGCWEWHGPRNPGGYGTLKYQGRTRTAHRMAHRMFLGEVPDGLHVLHHCDNRKCVSPTHIYAGTHQDNMRDKVVRNRSAKGDDHGLRRHPERAPAGARNGHARLTAELVIRIRERRAAGAAPIDLACEYGVTSVAICAATSGKTWKAVGGPLTPTMSKVEAARATLAKLNESRKRAA